MLCSLISLILIILSYNNAMVIASLVMAVISVIEVIVEFIVFSQLEVTFLMWVCGAFFLLAVGLSIAGSVEVVQAKQEKYEKEKGNKSIVSFDIDDMKSNCEMKEYVLYLNVEV